MKRHGIGKLLPPLVPLALLAACAQPEWVPEDASAPPLPERAYHDAARQGEAVYQVDPQRSRVYIRTGRDGPMKAAGHDHVIASADVEGLVLLSRDAGKSRADLRLPLPRLIVDDPAYREQFGLKPDLSQSAIDGTTRNMQVMVLESNLFPWATASVRLRSMQGAQAELGVTVSLHGVSLDYTVPAELTIEQESISASGSMTLHHSDFGLTPFSAAGGLLRVAEDIEIIFEIVASTRGQ
jgi:polyisoprenoid-binding protein YceI